MDKITQETLLKIHQLKKDLQKCERRLHKIGKARVPFYFDVPFAAFDAFFKLHACLDDMERQLSGKSSLREG